VELLLQEVLAMKVHHHEATVEEILVEARLQEAMVAVLVAAEAEVQVADSVAVAVAEALVAAEDNLKSY
jgi:hypothetical protein